MYQKHINIAYIEIENIKTKFADELFLGLKIHTHLKCDLHKIASKILRNVYQLKHIIPSEFILTINNGLIKAQTIYGIQCWGFNNEIYVRVGKSLIHWRMDFSKNLNVYNIDCMFILQLPTLCFNLIQTFYL